MEEAAKKAKSIRYQQDKQLEALVRVKGSEWVRKNLIHPWR